jgi:hypothetical protein
MNSLSHGSGILVDRHHADLVVVFEQGHVAAVLLGFL